MTRFARLQDLFLRDREPQSALFCTYGFDPRFFESEVIPAMFPISLGLDSESGLQSAYLNAADTLLAQRRVAVFYDHFVSEGPELHYAAWPVYVAPRAFHPKLIVLDYGDVIRVVIGSANLTTAAWTRLLELFVVEDLVPGQRHPWSDGIEQFLVRLKERIPDGHADLRDEIIRNLSSVHHTQGASRVTSTWEEPLLDALLHNVSDARAVHAVTPFFEESDGPGVFDALERRLGSVKGRLYTSTTDADGTARVYGPPEKLRALITKGGWELHGVKKVWDGDEDDAPLRELHGKLLSVTDANGIRSMLGSANLTRAALLERAPHANVELVVIEDQSAAELRQALPQATRLHADAVDFEEPTDTDEDHPVSPGPGRYILEATYTAKTGRLSLVIAPGAPDLVIRYEDTLIEGQLDEHVWTALLDLGLHQYVTVHDGGDSSIVPFVIVDPSALEPRGAAAVMNLEDFLEILAGRREGASTGEPEVYGEPGGVAGDGLVVGTRGAIPWRKYLAAVEGIGFELEQELHVETGLRFTIENPTRLAGLLDRLDEARDELRFTKADLLYALYELGRELGRVLALDAPDGSRRLLEDARADIERRSAELVSHSGRKLASQIRVLKEMDRA